jgi:hypothetical protein
VSMVHFEHFTVAHYDTAPEELREQKNKFS